MVSFTICHNLFTGKPVRGPLHPDYALSVFSYAAKAAGEPPSTRDLQAIKHSHMGSRTRECGRTFGRTAQPTEMCEPEKHTVVLAESGEQEEDTVILVESLEQEEDAVILAGNGEQEEDAVILAKSGKQEEETELAENWEDCGSSEELCTEQYSRNEENAQDLRKLLEFQKVEIGKLQIENEQLIQENTKL